MMCMKLAGVFRNRCSNLISKEPSFQHLIPLTAETLRVEFGVEKVQEKRILALKAETLTHKPQTTSHV